MKWHFRRDEDDDNEDGFPLKSEALEWKLTSNHRWNFGAVNGLRFIFGI